MGIRYSTFLALFCIFAFTACSGLSKTAAIDFDNYKGHYKVGNPYEIDNQWYTPSLDFDYEEEGIASWYGPNFHGKKTANGDKFNQDSLTAAHKTLPLPSMVRVTNLENGRTLIVMVNDRGPFSNGRIIDLSRRSAELLGFKDQGIAKVKVTFLPGQTSRLLAKLGMEQQSKEIAAFQARSSSETLPKPLVIRRVEPASSRLSKLVSSAHAAEIPAKNTMNKPKAANIVSKPAPVANTTPEPNTPPVKEAVPISMVPSTKTLFIQAGAYKEKENAYAMASRLYKFGTTDVSPKTLANNQTLYRVRVGPLYNQDNAEWLLRNITQSGYSDAIIISK